MEFHKLACHGNEMSITHKKPFDTAAKAFKLTPASAFLS